jgi:pyridoxal phosphate enzyme (YggS family)
MLPETEIQVRLDEVSGRVGRALARAGRRADACRLVLASKTQPAAAVAAAYRAGAREFAENYVQEGVAKRAQLTDFADVRWHLIGHLQSNKTKIAAATFDLIQTLDSARLALALHKLQPIPPVPVLIEVNLGGEAGKPGVAPDQTEALITEVREKVAVTGLMTIPPPTNAREYFAQLRNLRDRLAAATGLTLSELSMGMTDDYEIAIEEGATIVRIGRAVFGTRN